MEQLIELLVLLGGTLLLAIVFGTYLARLISYENRPIEKTVAIVESRFYRLIGIDVSKQMTWKQYFFALFLTDVVVVGIVISILTFQNYQHLTLIYIFFNKQIFKLGKYNHKN